MKKTLICFLSLIFLLTTGCAKKVFVLQEGFTIKEDQTKSIEVMYFYDSFGKSESIKAYSFCSKGLGGIEYDKSIFDSLIAIVSFNIITPRRITFYCYD